MIFEEFIECGKGSRYGLHFCQRLRAEDQRLVWDHLYVPRSLPPVMAAWTPSACSPLLLRTRFLHLHDANRVVPTCTSSRTPPWRWLTWRFTALSLLQDDGDANLAVAVQGGGRLLQQYLRL